MAFLDEIGALLEGSSTPLFPVISSGVLTSFDSTDNGQRMDLSSGILIGVTTSSSGFTANVRDGYLSDFGGTLGLLNSAWPLFLSHLPDSTTIGNKAVALLETPGEPEPGRVDIDKRGLQIFVRGEPTNQTSTAYQDTEAISIDIRDALHDYAGSSETQGRHYVGIWNESGPFFVGFDESYRPQFSANYRAWRTRTT